MNRLALDFATVAPDAATGYISDFAEDQLVDLATNLMTMYRCAARRLRTDLGLMAVAAALNHIVEHDPDLNHKSAADLIRAWDAMSDTTGVEADLRAHGAEAIDQRVHLVCLFDRMVPTVAAIPAIWRCLLPELNPPAGQALLEMFAEEIV
jgi:hypothetical protein